MQRVDKSNEIPYTSELYVSSKFDSARETFTNIKVCALPPSESLISIVTYGSGKVQKINHH
jgi:hypothetical protein